MKETLKSKKGITLIALVITIIVLIILAGISISLLMEENGLITKAKEGRQNMQNAAIEEQERLNTLYAEFESGVVGTGSYDAIAQLINFKRTIAQAITDAGVATSEDDDAETMAENISQLGEDSTEAPTPVLLWENPSYTETTYFTWTGTTIPLDLTEYKAVWIYTLYYGDVNNSPAYRKFQWNYIDLDLLDEHGSYLLASTNGSWRSTRLVTRTLDGLNFTNATRSKASSDLQPIEAHSTIPVRIYGVKNKLI